MTYVMSDIHGMYEKYMKMLEHIGFSDDDEMYIIGDTIDRGAHPAEVLLDMMERPNVFPVIGNHELMAVSVLDIIMNGEKEDQPASFEDMMTEWLINGGAHTLESLSALPRSKQYDILDYFSEFSNYEAVDIGDKTFIMVHAGFDNFRQDRKLSDYSVRELVWHRPDPCFRYFDDVNIYVVSGHTPTLAINGEPKIIHSSGNILIDCGACIGGGRLACLCLDTMEEFYI